MSYDPQRDLTIERVIKAPRAALWRAWAEPARFEQWWLPSPYHCRVMEMELAPGGSFLTRMSEDGLTFTPHITGCFLAVDPMERIVFTTAMSAGWRPHDGKPLALTASITFADHPDGALYRSHVLHKDQADRDAHQEMGFEQGWGTVIAQLAALVEGG